MLLNSVGCTLSKVIYGAIIFGGVSLASDYPNLLNSRNPLLSRGIYKIEGSIIVLIVNVILITYLFILNKRVTSQKYMNKHTSTIEHGIAYY